MTRRGVTLTELADVRPRGEHAIALCPLGRQRRPRSAGRTSAERAERQNDGNGKTTTRHLEPPLASLVPGIL